MISYPSYPDVRALHPELTEPGEIEIASQLKLIENIQQEMWGKPINNGNILKPIDPQLNLNWIAGGFYQYQLKDYVLTSTFALSRPTDDDPTEEVEGKEVRYSGFGVEYLIKTRTKENWPTDFLYRLVRSMYSGEPAMLLSGQYVNYSHSLFNGSEYGLVCVQEGENILMPDGIVEYLTLVPVKKDFIDWYISLEKRSNQILREALGGRNQFVSEYSEN